MKAIVFVRSGSPRLGLVEAGHVGWGFEIQPGMFNIGAVEKTGNNAHPQAHPKDFWSFNTAQPYRPFGLGPVDPKTGVQYLGYDMHKIIEVPNANPRAAIKAVEQVDKDPYYPFGGNCMDSAYKILSEYGAVLPKPAENWLPIGWFKAIKAQAYVLQDAAASIDFSLYEHPNFEGDSLRIIRVEKEFGQKNVHYEGREIGDCVSSINLRSGKLRVFEHPDYKGKSVDFVAPCIINSLAPYGMEDKISSFYAWA